MFSNVQMERSERVQYGCELYGQVKNDFQKSTKGLPTESLGGTSGALRALNILMAVTGGVGDLRDDKELDAALDGATVVLEAMTIADESTALSSLTGRSVPTWVKRVPGMLGPTLDVVTGLKMAHDAASDTDARGQALIADSNYLTLVGGFASSSTALVGFLVGGGVGVAIGLVGAAVSTGLQLADEYWDHVKKEANDPLTGWLAPANFWGKDFSAGGTEPARKALLTAVSPQAYQSSEDTTADPSSMSLTSGRTTKDVSTVMTDDGQYLVEGGFAFPTTVSVDPDADLESGPGRILPYGPSLTPHIAYLPSYGTLMVDATISATGLIDKTVALQWAVHYVETEEGIRYCAKSETSLSLEDGTSLVEHAKKEWALAEHQTVAVGGGQLQAPALEVLLSPIRSQERAEQISSGEQSSQRQPQDNDRTASPLDPDPPTAPVDQIDRGTTNFESASSLDVVHVQKPDYEDILDSGQFEVNGSVFFSPLQPFNPSPTLPKSGEDPTMMAEQEFEYRYPESAR